MKTLGVEHVPLANETTVVLLRVENHTAYPNIYNGIITTDPRKNLTPLIKLVGLETAAPLFIENSDGDDSIDARGKGLLITHLSTSDQADRRESVIHRDKT